jgi:hypothetical protein
MHTLSDRALSALAIGLVVVLGWRMTERVPPAPAAEAPRTQEARPVLHALPLRSRVLLVSEAIARSEGYYAGGRYDGRSLAYFLNNPGLLKATPVGDALETWEDTGLLVFDTPEIGWTALRHQVCTMLTGTSRVYVPADDLIAVGIKYAAGDANWGANVAWHLGLPAHATLADLGRGLPEGVRCATL